MTLKVRKHLIDHLERARENASWTWAWPLQYLWLFADLGFGVTRSSGMMLVMGGVGLLAGIVMILFPMLIFTHINNPTAYIIQYSIEAMTIYLIGALGNAKLPGHRPGIKLLIMSLLGGCLAALLLFLGESVVRLGLDWLREVVH